MIPAPSDSNYVTINGILYFVVGKTKIKVTEHFPATGPTVNDLIEDAITYSAKSA